MTNCWLKAIKLLVLTSHSYSIHHLYIQVSVWCNLSNIIINQQVQIFIQYVFSYSLLSLAIEEKQFDCVVIMIQHISVFMLHCINIHCLAFSLYTRNKLWNRKINSSFLCLNLNYVYILCMYKYIIIKKDRYRIWHYHVI